MKTIKKTVWYKSTEDGNNMKYKTMRNRDGSYTCFCPGWVFMATRAIHGHARKVETSDLCKHVKRLKEVVICQVNKRPLPILNLEDYKKD